MAELVNAAYGLTAEEVALLWATAPPRMPGRGRAYDRWRTSVGRQRRWRMQRLEIDVPDDLAETLAPYRDRLADVLRIGLRAIEARQTEQQRAGDDQPACAPSTEIPPLVARLDQFRGSLSGARTFDDSADAIREERDRRAAAL